MNDIFLECGLQLLPKIRYEHVYLTPYPVMNVRLAAQVLSTPFSKVLSNYEPADAAKTAEFCLMSSTIASSRQLKPFNAQFSSIFKIFRRLVKISWGKTSGIYKIWQIERFCQDPLENYFGKQRSSWATKDNPSLYDVG